MRREPEFETQTLIQAVCFFSKRENIKIRAEEDPCWMGPRAHLVQHPVLTVANIMLMGSPQASDPWQLPPTVEDRKREVALSITTEQGWLGGNLNSGD